MFFLSEVKALIMFLDLSLLELANVRETSYIVYRYLQCEENTDLKTSCSIITEAEGTKSYWK